MKKIVVLIPGSMPRRFFCETPIISHFIQNKRIQLSVLTTDDIDKERFESYGITWNSIYKPEKRCNPIYYSWLKICNAIQLRFFKLFGVTFESLAYRFNNIHCFKSHEFKVKMPPERKKREALAGNYVDERLGYPFPKSTLMYKLLYRVLYGKLVCLDPDVYSYLRKQEPDLVVFLFSQNILLQSWHNAARRLQIKTVSITGSWDRLTTKGHIFPNFDKYIVHSNKMIRDLVKYHEVDEQKIVNTGWPQMDHFFSESRNANDREKLCDAFGIPKHKKILLVATNGQRFGVNEPSILEHIREKIRQDAYKYPVFLIVRPHPNDLQWKERLSPKNIMADSELLLEAEAGNIQLLGDLLRSVDLMISTQGSISLDAIAMDVPVINLSFDCGDVDESESINRLYEMDHYSEIANSSAVYVAKSMENMDEYIDLCLNDRLLNASSRDKVRNKEVKPFDGKASERLVLEVVSTI